MRGLSQEAKQIVQCAMVLTEHQTPRAAAVTFMEAAGEMHKRATGALKAPQQGWREPHLKLLESSGDAAASKPVEESLAE